MAHIDAAEGIYFQRWGDAPIHTIAVGLLLGKRDLHRFSGMSKAKSETEGSISLY